MKETATRKEAAMKVDAAEMALQNYRTKNYGPLWGENNEQDVERLWNELQKAYDEAGTPEDDRLVG